MTLDLAVDALALVATGVLGVSAGALVAEGGVLVPFWRAERPEAFLAWYRTHAALLVGFYGPLEIAALVLATAVLAANAFHPTMASAPWWIAVFSSVGVLAAFPLYFQKANASFATGSISHERLPEELRRWSRWHWARTGLALVAFAFAAIALGS
jgi:hypothetical protein